MSSEEKKKPTKNKNKLPYSRTEILLLSLIGIVFININYFFPAQADRTYATSLDYLLEMALILPPVLILMGLFEVWVHKEFIERHLGIGSGIKGIFLAFFFGTLPTGPLYVAFPIASALLKKGARIMNVTIFLGAWAATKLPQVMVEIKFLGIEFTLLLQMLTVISVISIGLIMEYVMAYRGAYSAIEQ